MKYGTKLKRIRLDKNLTLKTVANALDIGISTLSQYESDTITPSPKVFHKLLDFYSVDAEAFVLAGKTAIIIDHYSEAGRKKAYALDEEERKKAKLIENFNKE